MASFKVGPSNRFGSDFVLVPDPQIPADEATYVTRINQMLSELETQGTSPDVNVAKLLEMHRKDLADRLQKFAIEISKIQDAAECAQKCRVARDKSFEYFGVYSDRCRAARSTPFSVEAIKGAKGLICDLLINTRDVPIPEDKQRFKVDVDRALAVIRAVLLERKNPRGDTSDDAWQRLHGYLTALKGIATVGLASSDSTQVELGKLALAGLKDEFVTREAGFVKNAYVLRLGVWALVVAFVSAAAYFLVQQYPGSVADRYKNFFLLAAGTSIGTWLSFSLRRAVLSFSDLAVLEEDRLRPELRIAFMVALTLVIGLLFWTHAIAVTVGGFQSDLAASAPSAVLIGALCGIAERAMASAVTKRADDFAASVGGRTQT